MCITMRNYPAILIFTHIVIKQTQQVITNPTIIFCEFF